MSSDDSSSQPSTSPAVPTRRRSSFTTNRLSEMFSAVRNPNSSSSGSPPNSPPAQSPAFNQNMFSNNAQANASANGRRMSISTLGLSGSNNTAAGSGPYSASGPSSMWGFRRGSSSTGPPSNASSDESAIDDSADAYAGGVVNANGPPPNPRRSSGNSGNVPPGSPIGRRMSFGARAMGQMRNEGQGFNWADNLRNRQTRSSSTAGSGLMSPTRPTMSENMPQPPTQAPAAKEPTPLPRREGNVKVPDHFQERILKGDFYMD